ncbi:MAG TPA: ABC transporter permease [Treponemataceae bacterium]|nr:ABC transporter permease [Treponemataceae bacterium]
MNRFTRGPLRASRLARLASHAAVPLASFGLALALIAALIALSSPDPLSSVASFFTRPFSSAWYLGNTLDMAGLLILAGTGSAVALRAGAFNLGGEAQIYAPALASAVILAGGAPRAAAALGLPPIATAFLALAAAIALGGALGFIPGILRARLGISELLSSFLLSAALIPVADYLVSGPFRDTAGNLVATKPIGDALALRSILPPSHLNVSFFVALAVAVAAWFFLSRTEPGYRLRMTGSARDFARFAGFPVARAAALAMAVSGALHGLAGYFAVTGTWYRCHEGFSSGMGWSALAIALVARRNPLAVIPAAIAFSWLETASDAATLSASLSFDATPLIQAIIFLVVSARYLPFRRKS